MIFSKPTLFVALLGVVSASIEHSNLRGNDRALIQSNDLTTAASNNCTDDSTFSFWKFVDKDCEMVRTTVNNDTYHDDNGDFSRIQCMEANSNRGSYCPSCNMTEVFDKCPTVCEPLRCNQAPVDPTDCPDCDTYPLEVIDENFRYLIKNCAMTVNSNCPAPFDVSPIGSWNTSKVTDMSRAFRNSIGFNQPIGLWDTSSVTTMMGMFGSTRFNQPIDSWDVSRVTSMEMMFMGTDFNKPIGSWNMSNVENMYRMFWTTFVFNQPIGSWDTSSVTTMRSVFDNSFSFNQPVEFWDTSSVTSMQSMFNNAESFNQPVDSWDTSSVTKMASMFFGADSFNQSLVSWDPLLVATVENFPR